MTTAYDTEEIIAGTLRSQKKTILTATVLKKGMLMGRITASNKYTEWASGASDGSEVIRAVCVRDEAALAADAVRDLWVGGTEIRKGGIVDSAGDPVVLTAAQIEQAMDNGIYVKEV
jgi:hypothetical protein